MPVNLLSKRYFCRGVSLIEVLVSIVLISIVLLGVAAMAMTSMNENQSAYYRSQANALAYDMADRIRLNSSFFLSSTDNYEFDSSEPGDLPASVNCTTGVSGCSEAQQASQDLREWAESFIDVNGIGVDGAAYRPLIPNAVGIIDRGLGADEVAITVRWQESDWQVSAADNKADRSHNLLVTLRVTN